MPSGGSCSPRRCATLSGQVAGSTLDVSRYGAGRRAAVTPLALDTSAAVPLLVATHAADRAVVAWWARRPLPSTLTTYERIGAEVYAGR